MITSKYKHKKCDKRTIKTKKAVHEALMNLMLEKPLGKITVSELAEEANISRKTFYLHYKKFRDVLDEMKTTIAEDLLKSVQEIQDNNDDISIALMIKQLHILMTQNSDFYSSLVTSGYGVYLKDAITDIICDTLIKSVDIKTAISDVQLHNAALMIASGASMLYMEWMEDHNKQSLDELIRTISAVANFGFFTYCRS